LAASQSTETAPADTEVQGEATGATKIAQEEEVGPGAGFSLIYFKFFSEKRYPKVTKEMCLKKL